MWDWLLIGFSGPELGLFSKRKNQSVCLRHIFHLMFTHIFCMALTYVQIPVHRFISNLYNYLLRIQLLDENSTSSLILCIFYLERLPIIPCQITLFMTTALEIVTSCVCHLSSYMLVTEWLKLDSRLLGNNLQPRLYAVTSKHLFQIWTSSCIWARVVFEFM
jgi:hypothetical protein